MGVKNGFKDFYKVWKKRDLLRELFEYSAEVLKKDQKMFAAASDALLRAVPIEMDIEEKDEQINKARDKIRKKVLEHMTLNPKKDIVAFMTLIDISRDLERIGDYSKDIAVLVTQYEKPLIDGPIVDELVSLYRTVLTMFEWTEASLNKANEKAAKSVIDAHLNKVMLRVDTLIEGLIEQKSGETQKAVVCALYARYLKRVSSHLMDIACTITSAAYHEMKKKKDS